MAEGTPDGLVVGSSREYLALYGSLMSCVGGLRRLGDTRGLRYVGPCTMQGRLVDLGRYPGLVLQEGLVEAELYEITDRAILDGLDRFEGYHRHNAGLSVYVRRRVRLREPDCHAWVYIYNKPYAGRPVIAGGSWFEHVSQPQG
ncbi:MAG: gamma-glutamylcyclotransferase family protein [Actinomycetota bacterium]